VLLRVSLEGRACGAFFRSERAGPSLRSSDSELASLLPNMAFQLPAVSSGQIFAGERGQDHFTAPALPSFVGDAFPSRCRRS
jgi:hypothetical protein